MKTPTIILLNGACGIGKSTIAKLLHDYYEFSFLREKDSQRRNISHYKNTPEHYKRSGGLILELTRNMVESCIKNKIDIIIDGVIIDEKHLQDLEKLITEKGGKFLHVYLNAPKDLRSKRLKNRGMEGGLTYEKAEFFYDSLSELKKKIEMIEIDTSKNTPEEICNTIKNIVGTVQ